MKKTLLIVAISTCVAAMTACGGKTITETERNKEMTQQPTPGTDGNKYVPYEQRTGEEAVVYFTRNLSAEGLIMA